MEISTITVCNDWLAYPENKPQLRKGRYDWYWVKLKDDSVHMACWWGGWYQYSDADNVIAFSELGE